MSHSRANRWHSPALCEIENRVADRAGHLTTLIQQLARWAGRDLLDIGCGTGFHLPAFAETSRSATGVEPHGDLAALARRRVRRLSQIVVLQGSADSLPLPSRSVDVAHARWSYFFGPGCGPA